MSASQHLPPRSAEEQARLDAVLTEVFEQRITFNQVLGLKVESLKNGDVRMGFEMRPDLIGHFASGRLHGGVTSASLDAVCGLAVMVGIAEAHPHEGAMQVLQRFSRVGTIDLRIDYLRQGIGQRFTGIAALTRLGGRVASAQARLVNEEGTLVATASGAYIVS
jgi:uncharacterized protein (TIGR00369 family)